MIVTRPDDDMYQIGQRERAESLIGAQSRVLELVASGASADAVLPAVAQLVERYTHAQCAIMVPIADGAMLRCAAAPTLPKPLIEAIDGLAIGPAATSCGAAAYRRAPVLSRDVETDPF
jgi:hypothetical protein